MIDTPRHLSVVIPTYAREEGCSAALASLTDVADRNGIEVEMIVVEQGERPSYRIPDGFRGRWLFSTVNGAAYARNIGLDHATCDAVLFLDDDAVTLDGLAALVDELARSSAAMACGRMISPDGSTSRGGPSPLPVTPTSTYHLFVETAAVWDRGRLEAIGGFDERLGPPLAFGAEEGAEVLSRLAAAGGTARYVPVDVVVHPALDATAAAKAFRYGRGTAGVMWLTPSRWTVTYAFSSAVRRCGGLIVSVARRRADEVGHRAGWLAGFAAGMATGWRLRREPARREHRPVESRV